MYNNPSSKSLGRRCLPAHAPACSPTAARLLPSRCSSRSSITQLQQAAHLPSSQLADDLDIIDALFETALEPGSSAPTAPRPTAGALPSSSPASAAVLAGRAQRSARAPASLPKRAAQLPWGSTSTAAVKPASTKPAASRRAAAAAASNKLLQQLRQQASTPAPTAATSRRSSSGNRNSSSSSKRRQVSFSDYDDDELWEDTDSTVQAGWLEQDQPGASSAVPASPWLVRRQQQQKQRRQKAKQAEAAAAAAAATAKQKEEVDAERHAVQQQLLRQQEWQANQQQQQQQQQQAYGGQDGPYASAGVPSSSFESQELLPQQVAQQKTPQELQQQQQQSQQAVQKQQGSLEQLPLQPLSSSASTSGMAVPSVLQQQQVQQQPQQEPLQIQQPVGAAALEDGVVRSSRRLRMQRAAPAAPSFSQQQQQHSLAVGSSDVLDQPAAATANPAPAAVPAGIGQAPLVVLGGRAAGSQVVWIQPPSMAAPPATPQQQQQQQQQMNRMPGQQAAARQQGGSSNSSSSATDNSTSSAAGYVKPHPAVQAAAVAGVTGAKVGAAKARYRRGRSLQGVPTSLAELPPPPAPAAALVTAEDAATAMNQQVDETSGHGLANSSSSGSSGSHQAVRDGQRSNSSTCSSSTEDLQQVLQRLNSDSWQRLASQLLPDVYDATWHGSMYAFMQDVWQLVLQNKGSPKEAAAGDAGSSSSSSAAAVSWCLEALYSPRQYIWGSTLLALVDSLAEDDVGLAVHVVQLLPGQLLQQVVLPAAELLDDEVHSALQQEVKRQSIQVGGSAAAVAAARALIGPAPWTLKQQQQQPGIKPLGLQQATSTPSSSTATIQGSAAAAAPAAGAIRLLPAAGRVVGLLQELQQLRGLYPGVDVAALAHVAELHGLWQDA